MKKGTLNGRPVVKKLNYIQYQRKWQIFEDVCSNYQNVKGHTEWHTCREITQLHSIPKKNGKSLKMFVRISIKM